MSINFTTLGGLFPRLGRMGKIAYMINAVQNQPVLGSLFTLGGIAANINNLMEQYDTDADQIRNLVQDLPAADLQYRQTLEAIMTNVQADALATLQYMVAQDQPAKGTDATTSVAEVCRQMLLIPYNVSRCTVVANVTALATNNGNGVVVINSIAGNGLEQELTLPETAPIVCTVDSQTGGATLNNETFTYQGDTAVADPWAWNYPGGSGQQTTLTSVDPTQSAAGGNILTNSCFAAYTGAASGSGCTLTLTVGGGGAITGITLGAGGTLYPASSTFNVVVGGTGTLGVASVTTNSSGVVTSVSGTPVTPGSGYSAATVATSLISSPTSWTISVGTAGLDFIVSSTQAYFGTVSLKFLKATTVLQSFKQQLPVQSSTVTVGIAPLTSFNLWLALYGDNTVTAGIITVDLIDGSNNVINDNQSIPNSFAVAPGSIVNGAWTIFNVQFRMPRALPSAVYVRIHTVSSLSGGTGLVGGNVYVQLALGQPTLLYPGGPSACVFAGSSKWLVGDEWDLVATNDFAGATYRTTFQWLFNRLFGTAAMGLLLPSAPAFFTLTSTQIATNTYTLTWTFPNGTAVTTASIAYNASRATILAALTLVAPQLNSSTINLTAPAAGTLPAQVVTVTLLDKALIGSMPTATPNANTVVVANSPTGELNCVQTISCNYTPTGGTFTLTFVFSTGVSVTTAGITYAATPANVASALLAASPVLNSSNVTCAGGNLPGTPITVTFNGQLAGFQNQMTIDFSKVTGGTPGTFSVSSTTAGTPTLTDDMITL